MNTDTTIDDTEQQRATSSTMKVLEAVRDLHGLQQLVTRETLEQATNLRLHVIDERIRFLINQGLVRRDQRGVYVPVVAWPESRAISKTLLPDGSVKIEIGDVVLLLTPHEDRMLSQLQAGPLAQLTAIEGNRQAAEVHSALADRVRALERAKQR
ncbi:hypothetical protein C8245_22990 [Paracidovorax avenae]|uniref:hypothetical protein n=1 Tax=Paracidovorax avenae TaxID=80867 RepID=UPI000D2050A2|nr:hypothetical protein [Paracidovorax avenae]AVS68145.1 hypothetical protein C8245_22990 [Paracidovorax avenae]